jgi:hypothetical protein
MEPEGLLPCTQEFFMGLFYNFFFIQMPYVWPIFTLNVMNLSSAYFSYSSDLKLCSNFGYTRVEWIGHNVTL